MWQEKDYWVVAGNRDSSSYIVREFKNIVDNLLYILYFLLGAFSIEDGKQYKSENCIDGIILHNVDSMWR